MRAMPSNLEVLDLHPKLEEFKSAVIQGLSQTQKSIPSKFLYDKKGSELFHEITKTPEYYQTNAEIAVLEACRKELASKIGESCLLVEYGSGNNQKVRLLLEALKAPACYAAVDISKEYLVSNASAVAAEFPELQIFAVCADFLASFEIPNLSEKVQSRLAYFPGSTLGNFEPETAQHILRAMAKVVGRGGYILLALDLVKETSVLEAAYNDSKGITAAFEKNILARANRELGTDFSMEGFSYRGSYNAVAKRIEMFLVSEYEQKVNLFGKDIEFKKGETIHVENSYKFTFDSIDETVAPAGLHVENRWSDADKLFGMVLARVARS